MSEMKKEEPREMNLVPTENVDKRTIMVPLSRPLCKKTS